MSFHSDRSKRMNDMRRKSPREFWKIFKPNIKDTTGDCISNNDFKEYFEMLMSGIQSQDDDGSTSDFLGNFDLNNDSSSPTFPSLDRTISEEEISQAIHRLNNNKACSIDTVLYEYFKCSVPILIKPLHLFFNTILNKGRFPRSWASGAIIPVYKKGDQSDPNNYRGITLISCFAKLFTGILNDRLKQWALENDILTDAQFGFKSNYSTVDPIFILNSLIQRQFGAKKKLYCCFVDFRKAYDCINRSKLWHKFIMAGVDGKFLSVLRSMYEEVKMCVKHLGSFSDFFDSNIGLFQGEITSPICFSLFLNDIEIHMQQGTHAGLTLDDINIFMLLFADDAVLLSESRDGLQEALDNLYTYCDRWNLTVNVDKTKIVVFRKGGRLSAHDEWKYNNVDIEIVNSFNYLGVVFTSGGSFAQAAKTLAGKAVRSMNGLLALIKDTVVPVNIMFNLFDAYVMSILNYGSEVWGFGNFECLERVHKRFCKWVLKVKRSTNTLALYSEVGRFPLYIERHIRCIKYFFKLVTTKSDNCILTTTLREELTNIDSNPTVSNWTSKVRDVLQRSGFNDVWMYPESVDISTFVPLLRSRLRDVYISDWRAGMNSCSSLYLYRDFKDKYETSGYINKLENIKFRHVLAKLRLSSHNLNIEVGRHNRIPRGERKCSLCNLNDIEDEYHFVLKCPLYADIRRQYIPSYYSRHSSMAKFITLLQSDNKSLLVKLAIYCLKAFKLRSESI